MADFIYTSRGFVNVAHVVSVNDATSNNENALVSLSDGENAVARNIGHFDLILRTTGTVIKAEPGFGLLIACTDEEKYRVDVNDACPIIAWRVSTMGVYPVTVAAAHWQRLKNPTGVLHPDGRVYDLDRELGMCANVQDWLEGLTEVDPPTAKQARQADEAAQ
jgi:hypothetical protein